jgi:phosphate transport system substrate-binding protein
VKFTKIAALATVALIATSWNAFAADLSGAGATFPYPVYAKWADSYKKETGIGLNYQSIGSGGGIKQIKAKTVTFGASDAPLPGKELDESGLAQFPMVMGGIVPVVNLDGVKPGDLVIDGPTLAKIFLGDIKKWDDPAIAKLNSGVKLPSQAIALVHRSDGSGTTYNFTYYLSDVSPDWKSKVGTNTAVQWPAGIGAKGNEGVANNVAQTKGSIGYVEYAYAKQNKLTFTKMINKAGKTVSPTSEAFQAAAANADWNSQPGFGVILANEPGDGRHLDPDLQEGAGCGGDQRSSQVLRVVVCQGSGHGQGSRLRADAGQDRRRHPEDVELRHQGCERQVALHAEPLEECGIGRVPEVLSRLDFAFGGEGKCPK